MTLQKDLQKSTRCASSRITGPATLKLFLCLLLATSSSARAEHGRDFSALYDFGKVTRIDERRVSVTLLVRLRNNSGKDVMNGSIRLVDRAAPGEALATLQDSVTIAYGASTKAVAIVTVEQSEYQRWVRGDAPRLVVNITDARGRQTSHPVELVRMPGVGAGP